MIAGIVVALPEELVTLAKFPGFSGKPRLPKGSYRLIAENLLIAYSGAGPSNARAMAEILVANGATSLISWGCAAALSDTLKAGDLILADELIDVNHQIVNFESAWQKYALKQLLQDLVVRTGSLVESEVIVSLSQDKQKLNSKTGAIALDMESIAIAKVASQNHLPFLAIRAIADTVYMDLPQAIKYALNSQGDVVIAKLLINLAMHPTQLPELIKLGFCFSAAQKTLKLVAKTLNSVIDFKDIATFQHA